MRPDRPLTLRLGDCIEVMRRLPDDTVDAIVTDPPYGLGFMGKKWDRLPPSKEWAIECLRVLKPGGHLLAFGGSRTWHRLAVAVEDAGFEIRDSIAWLYGSGFPKSLDVSKAIDKAAGAERVVLGAGGKSGRMRNSMAGDFAGEWDATAPATDAARQWQGWGTALKPAFEPIVVARKPLASTVAANVLQHGTGALNIDACRGAAADVLTGSGTPPLQYGGANSRPFHADAEPRGVTQNPAGRWPANVVMDESQAAELDRQTGVSQSRIGKPRSAAAGEGWGMTATGAEYADQGGASRFFPTFRYQAKASTGERPHTADGTAHPTVKPVELMRWLLRLVTPPGGLVLDPFLGSGTTAQACLLEGFRCLGIDYDPVSLELTRIRLGLV